MEGRAESREINHTRREGKKEQEKRIGMKTRPACRGVFMCVCAFV